MIPVNYSLTRDAVDYIYKQQSENDSGFIQQEVITRIAGVGLSILQLVDIGIHSVGVVESAFYSLYQGLFENKPIDFSLSQKHLKCIKIFAQSLFTTSFAGLAIPRIETFSKIESQQISAIRGLLLSRQEEYYTENNHINPLEFATYVQSLAEKLSPEEKVGMEETIELLEETKGLLEDFDQLKNQETILDGYLSKLLSDGIKSLIKRDSTLLERIVFKEILARILALGLTFAAAIDVITRILITAVLLELVLLDTLLFKGRLLNGDIKQTGQFFLYHLRDIGLSIVGALSGSLVGVVSPSLACEMATPSSGFYDNLRFSVKDIYNSAIEKAKKLDLGKSILIPISIPYKYGSYDAGHFVTVLVRKDGDDSYTVSIINKGLGSHRETGTPDLSVKKIPIHVTSTALSTEIVEKYLTKLIGMICESEDKFVERAEKWLEVHNVTVSEDKKLDPKDPEIQKLVIDAGLTNVCYQIKEFGTRIEKPADLLIGKHQNTGDCPKASLLGALHYHSFQKSGTSKHYKKFLNNIKKRSLEEDGHLLDIALSFPLTKEKPSIAAKTKVDKAQAQLLSLS